MAGNSAQQQDVAALIQEFSTDAARVKLELPNTLTVEERKKAKQLVDTYPGLTCESFGFGAGRQLHVFKKTPVEPSVRVRNTFIDDWVCSQDGETDGPQFRSMPTALFSKDSVDCKIPQDPKVISLAPPAELAESSPLNNTSAAPKNSPKQAVQVPLPNVPEGFNYTVRDTFIHIDCDRSPAEERAFRSMPHGLFTSNIAAELAAADCANAPMDESNSYQFQPPTPPFSPPWHSFDPQHVQDHLPTGTEVIIQGLTKLTAFNGQAGTIQEYDSESERYKVILHNTAAGHRMAKVKLDNLLTNALPPPPLHHANAPTLLCSAQEVSGWEGKQQLSSSMLLSTSAPTTASVGACSSGEDVRTRQGQASCPDATVKPLSLDGLV